MPLNFNKAEFVRSAGEPKDFLRDGLPQFAFAGRSNVGKSSVINRLVGRKNLAYVGASPGKTTHINYFLIDQKAYLVDLPGYGYAKVSRSEKERWARLMETYFQREADAITTGVLIVDIRHKPTENDLVMHDWFRQSGCPEIVVANKLDKLKKSQVEPALELIRETLELTEENILLPFSAEKGDGRDALIRLLLDACEETPTVDAVNFPNEEAERAATQHLIDRGCRNIAIVGHRSAPRADLAHAQNAFALRLRGACGALSDAGLPYDESMVFEAGDVANGIIAGHAIAERILAARSGHGGTEFDGACCANDFAAFGVIRGLADRGLRVPQDVKVIGFDGVTSGSYTTPALSTIQVDFTQLAKFSVDMLSERIDHGTDEALPPRRAIIGYQLVDRESTAV